MPSVSVVLPAYNAAATIGDTLQALLGQAGAPPDREIIVVDNGSTDETPAIVARYPGIRLLHESVRGPAAARNCGLRHAAKDIVVHLDADTLPARTWLARIVAPFDDSQVTLVGGRTLIFHPMTPVERYIAGAGLYETERAITRPPFPFVPSLNMAVRRSAALEVGGWDVGLLTAEDVDFSHRVLKRYPGSIAYARDAVLFHRVRATPEQLIRLADSYGRGVAAMYMRYRDEVRWDLVKTVKVRGRVGLRAIEAAMLRWGAAVRLVPPARADFSYCHYLWSRHFARGFFTYYRHARWEARA
jgi:glycosyltransferase involved in cell wall biosynthesis